MKNEIHRKTKDGKLPEYIVGSSQDEDVWEIGFKEGRVFSIICEVSDIDDAWEICDALNARKPETTDGVPYEGVLPDSTGYNPRIPVITSCGLKEAMPDTPPVRYEMADLPEGCAVDVEMEAGKPPMITAQMTPEMAIDYLKHLMLTRPSAPGATETTGAGVDTGEVESHA